MWRKVCVVSQFVTQNDKKTTKPQDFVYNAGGGITVASISHSDAL